MKKNIHFVFMIIFSCVFPLYAEEVSNVKPSESTNAPSPVKSTNPATPSPASTPPIKPETTTPPTDITPTDPAKPTAVETDKISVPAIKKEEPELDAETKRLLEEAKQKILKEKAAREAAQKRAVEESEKRKEVENSFLANLYANSKLYLGLAGGLNLSLNEIHRTGFGGGITADYTAFRHYGLHLAAATGQFSAKEVKLVSGDSTLTISSNGTFGFLTIDAALGYVFPQIWRITTYVGIGGNYYQLKGGNYSFGPSFAPLTMISAHCILLWNFDIGLLAKITLPSASNTQINGNNYDLDSGVGLTQVSLHLSFRYAWLNNP